MMYIITYDMTVNDCCDYNITASAYSPFMTFDLVINQPLLFRRRERGWRPNPQAALPALWMRQSSLHCMWKLEKLNKIFDKDLREKKKSGRGMHTPNHNIQTSELLDDRLVSQAWYLGYVHMLQVCRIKSVWKNLHQFLWILLQISPE